MGRPPPPLARAALAEFLGTLVFQLLGGSATYAPMNGLILTVVIYVTAAASGGVVNPAVATSLLAVGEMSAAKWAVYVAVELLGAVAGALLAALADPTAPLLSSWSVDGIGPGCVPTMIGGDLYGPVFIWEAVGTFVLCATVLSTAVAKPGHGNVAPLAIGLAVAVNVGTSGGITGGCYNPARFFGPAVVYGCRLHLVRACPMPDTVSADSHLLVCTACAGVAVFRGAALRWPMRGALARESGRAARGQLRLRDAASGSGDEQHPTRVRRGLRGRGGAPGRARKNYSRVGP